MPAKAKKPPTDPPMIGARFEDVGCWVGAALLLVESGTDDRVCVTGVIMTLPLAAVEDDTVVIVLSDGLKVDVAEDTELPSLELSDVHEVV